MKRVIWGFVGLFVLIFGVREYEQHTDREFKYRATVNAEVLAPHLWDYDMEMAEMAGQLALKSEGWAFLKLSHKSGKEFMSVGREAMHNQGVLSYIQRIDEFEAPVVDSGQIIGVLRVVRINRNDQIYLVIGLLLLLLTLGGSLFVRDLRRNESLARYSLAAETHKRIETEVLLLQREAQLEQARKQESLGRLASGVAHDFNNVLSIIINTAELLAFKVPDDKVQIASESIINAAFRAATITKELLAFGSRQAISPQSMNMNTTLVSMRALLASMIGDPVDIEMKLDPGIKNIYADPDQIERVILNLVGNAADAMNVGGTIEITTVVEGEFVILLVRDDGHGMKEEVKQLVFEPFFTTRTENEGTGLGLSIVYGIVMQSGGTISVDSTPGVGTCFRLSFPVHDGDVTTESSTPAVGVDIVPTAGTCIVLVEDQPDLGHVLCEALGSSGYWVRSYSGPEEALVDVQKPLDLLVTDISMPDRDGKSMAKEFRKIHPDLKVVYISGFPTNEPLGEDEILLVKPFGMKTLLRTMKQHLQE